jgi:hypothetical protein
MTSTIVSRSPSLPAGFTDLVRECIEVLCARHVEEGKLLAQRADLLTAVAVQESDEHRNQPLTSRLVVLNPTERGTL